MQLLLILLYIIIGVDYLYPFCFRYFGMPELPPSTIEFSIFVLFLITLIKRYISSRNFINSDIKLRRYRYFILAFLIIALLSSIINFNNMFLVAKVFLNFSFINLILFITILEIDFNEKRQFRIIK